LAVWAKLVVDLIGYEYDPTVLKVGRLVLYINLLMV